MQLKCLFQLMVGGDSRFIVVGRHGSYTVRWLVTQHM